MKKAIPLASKILLVLAILITGYYFFFLKPKADSAANEKLLSKHYSILLQNRLSYVDLIKLDPKSPNTKLQKNDLLSKVESTQKEGLTFASKEKKFGDLMSKTKKIYERQAKIIEELKTKKTFEEGIGLLKGQESVSLLTDQTNLILEYQYWLEKLKAKR